MEKKLGKVFLGVGAAAAGFVVPRREVLRGIRRADVAGEVPLHANPRTRWTNSATPPSPWAGHRLLGHTRSPKPRPSSSRRRQRQGHPRRRPQGRTGPRRRRPATLRGHRDRRGRDDQFGLKGSEVPHIADLLAAGADKAHRLRRRPRMALNSPASSPPRFGLPSTTPSAPSAFAQAGLPRLRRRYLVQDDAHPARETVAAVRRADAELGINTNTRNGQFIGLHQARRRSHDQLGSSPRHSGTRHSRQIFRQRRDPRRERALTRTARPGSRGGSPASTTPASPPSRRPGRWTTSTATSRSSARRSKPA